MHVQSVSLDQFRTYNEVSSRKLAKIAASEDLSGGDDPLLEGHTWSIPCSSWLPGSVYLYLECLITARLISE